MIDLIGVPESVARAREYVGQRLGGGHPALADVTLLVSEVVTNAVVHSDSRNGGLVTLAIADCFDRIHVDVVDAGGGTAPCVGGDMFAESGRGLMLVEAISHRWNVYEDEAGRTVWFQVKYKAGRVPRQRSSGEAASGHESAVRRTARLAAEAVAQTVERDRRQRQAWHLIDRWKLDPEGLDQAAQSLGVEAISGDVPPQDRGGSTVIAHRTGYERSSPNDCAAASLGDE
ncbi:ATP-binding protein [Sphaerisporangium sp. TRM90804]|uniref:ATP-binding protein n=1 Tax=Sphaerisporangium sp. TRM90804 TaxID=3031113 RepID=UPI0024471798|nr:ATP-binding protein [Sphaerisporangium sp. TRM90804]MDH2426933.1 ATP-binding protein [Sphaerisporangium sp. TRM90804]